MCLSPPYFAGSALTVCQTTSLQCCTQGYLDRVEETLGEELLESLREQIGNSVDLLDDVFEDFEDCELCVSLKITIIYWYTLYLAILCVFCILV